MIVVTQRHLTRHLVSSKSIFFTVHHLMLRNFCDVTLSAKANRVFMLSSTLNKQFDKKKNKNKKTACGQGSTITTKRLGRLWVSPLHAIRDCSLCCKQICCCLKANTENEEFLPSDHLPAELSKIYFSIC